MRSPSLIGLAAALAALALPAAAQTSDRLRREVAEIGVTERLGATVPPDLAFEGLDGRPVTFGELRGQPVLLSFNYASCPRLCGLQLSGLARALREARWDGGGFAVATVSLDPEESPELLQRQAGARVRDVDGGPGVEASWRFLIGRKPAIDRLAEAVGFRYRYDPATKEFAHQATLVVLTADGRVSGYLHGISYKADAFRTALERAGAGRVGTAAEQAGLGGFLLSCVGLDPARPLPLAMVVMRIGGVAVLAFLLGFLGFHLLRDARRSRARRDQPAA